MGGKRVKAGARAGDGGDAAAERAYRRLAAASVRHLDQEQVSRFGLHAAPQESLSRRRDGGHAAAFAGWWHLVEVKLWTDLARDADISPKKPWRYSIGMRMCVDAVETALPAAQTPDPEAERRDSAGLGCVL